MNNDYKTASKIVFWIFYITFLMVMISFIFNFLTVASTFANIIGLLLIPVTIFICTWMSIKYKKLFK